METEEEVLLLVLANASPLNSRGDSRVSELHQQRGMRRQPLRMEITCRSIIREFTAAGMMSQGGHVAVKEHTSLPSSEERLAKS